MQGIIMNKTTTWYLDSKTFHFWAYLNNVFSVEECEFIKSIGNNLQIDNGTIVGKDGKTLDTNVRKNLISWFDSSQPEHQWIFQRCTDAVITLNRQFWNFDLDYIESLQYTIYDQAGDGYRDHIDTLHDTPHYRKLSFSIQLDDPETYKGADLMLNIGTEKTPTGSFQGTMTCFPSLILHNVTPLVSGKRRSLVGWVCGPKFK
jgi:predicted 2-oxoglutarate/Fe(II)-dependent dioxygenase YbiX